MRVGVCDFPSRYAFPPYGYGGIERWLWAVAVGALRAGARVHLLGPGWRPELPAGYERLPVRLESADDAQLRRLAGLDLDVLVVGHEYPSHPQWRAKWAELSCKVITFQHDPDFGHLPEAFDGTRSRLYCYSPEMAQRYAAHQPRETRSVQFGLGEENPPPATDGVDLVWLGRIDRHKAPHLAVQAAAQLGRRLRIIGPVLDQTYLTQHRESFAAEHVEWLGELAGPTKLEALRTAGTLVYTCDRTYVEAGAAVFGEALRCGTPVAALAWRLGTCADAALCPETGAVAHAPSTDDDQEAAARLADAIIAVDQLDPRCVQAIGVTRFDPTAHFHAMAHQP